MDRVSNPCNSIHLSRVAFCGIFDGMETQKQKDIKWQETKLTSSVSVRALYQSKLKRETRTFCWIGSRIATDLQITTKNPLLKHAAVWNIDCSLNLSPFANLTVKQSPCRRTTLEGQPTGVFWRMQRLWTQAKVSCLDFRLGLVQRDPNVNLFKMCSRSKWITTIAQCKAM